MEENKVEKNKRKYLTVGIITTIIMLALGITLAVTDWTKLFVISGTSGCFTINYTKGQDVTSGIEVGTSYSDKGVSSDIVMYKDPTCKVDALGTLYITTNDTSSIDFTTGALKYSVVVDNTEVSSGSVSGETNQVIYNFYLNDTPTTYKVYLWLDINLYQEREGDTYSGFVHAEAIQVTQKSEPNSPELVQGLIPVTYNETTKQWVKADTTNTGNNWYNYLNKKWANAVLVNETGYVTTDKTVNISNSSTVINNLTSNNQGIGNSTATSTITITTGSEAGTLSFDYSVSSESNYDKLTITVNGTTIANAISGEASDTYSVSATANTTYTIVATYKKDGSGNKGTDTASITNIVLPTGSTISVTPGSSYYFDGLYNKFASNFTYSNNKYVLKNVTSSTISSAVVGKYICPDISKSECTTMYKITGASDKITKVKEFSGTEEKRTKYSNAEAGTEINDSDILAFYVWIPRYKYRVWDMSRQASSELNYLYKAKTSGIDIVFEREIETTGTINCNYNYNVDTANGGIDLSTTTAEICTGKSGDYYTHPAFTFGDDELKGFWIGKFELSSETPSASYGGGSLTTLTPRILPNVVSWRFNNLANFFTVIQNMQKDNNIYGLSTDKTNTDSHTIKNMEWGAVTYLTNSNFGRCTGGSCTGVSKNNCSTYITGIGENDCNSDTNKYNGTKGVLASTTGNVYGVYDMSGGSSEYVMANISSVSESYTFSPSDSGFASNWYDTESNRKYLDTYAYYSSNSDYITSGRRFRLGDATTEVFFITYNNTKSWWNYSGVFPYGSKYSWISSGALFSFININGFNAGSNGDGKAYYTSTRAILAPLT